MKQNKQWLRLTAVLLCAVLAVALVGCSGGDSIEAKLKSVAENLAKQESYEYTMNMSMGLSMLGNDVAVETAMDGTVFNDPLKAKIVSNVSMMGSSVEVEMYMVQEGDNYVIYTGTMGQWQKQTVSKAEFEAKSGQYDAQDSMALYLKNAKNFQDMGYEDVEGVSTLKVQGFLSGDSIKEVMETSGVLDNAASSMEGVDEKELTDKIIAKIGDLPVTLWIDEKEMLPLKYEVDMSDMIKGMYDVIFEQMGVDPAEAQFEAGDAIISMLCRSYGAATAFEIPAEALAADAA